MIFAALARYKHEIMTQRVYMDYNATAPLRFEALEAMTEVLRGAHNASSVHAFGREGRKIVERAREQVAALCNAPPAQVVFNSGATEGNNAVVAAFKGERVLVSAIEHPSVLEAVKFYTDDYALVPVTADGLLDLAALEDLLRARRTALVSVMAVNNETGVIQPAAEISALAHRHGALHHCDGVQAAGRIGLDVQAAGIDFLTLSAHKIGGPQGVGALVMGVCGVTPKLLHGGGQEKSARAGTENVAGIAGFGVAAVAARAEIERMEDLARLRGALEAGISALSPGAVFYGRDVPRAANVTLFSLPGFSSETLVMAMDLEGVAVSGGSACSSGRVGPSHVLAAMGAAETSGLRLSLGWASMPEDVGMVLERWGRVCARLKTRGGGGRA